MAPASAQITTVAGEGALGRAGCGALPSGAAGTASFLVLDNRSWPLSGAAYALPQAEALVLTCRMRAGAFLLAESSASVLMLAPALPLPRDIFVFRPAMWALQSLRDGAVVPLPAGAAASSGGSTRTPTSASGSNATALVDSGSGSPSGAAVDPAAVAVPGALAAAAVAYSAASTAAAAASQAQSQSQSLALTGSATLVVLLGPGDGGRNSTFSTGSDSLQYPSLSLLRAEAASVTSSFAAAAAAALSALSSLRRSLRLAARIGGVRANVTWLSDDGTAAVLAAPAFASVCGGAAIGKDAPASASSARSGSCGYQALQLWYEPDPDWGDGSDSSGNAARRLQHGGRSLQGAGASPSPSPAASPLSSVLAAWAGQWLAAAQAGGATAPNATAATAAAAAAGRLLPVPVIVQSPPWTPGAVPAGSFPLAVPLSAITDGLAAAALPPPGESWMGALLPGRHVLASDGSVVAVEPQPASLAALGATAAFASTSAATGSADASASAAVLSGASAPFFYTAACAAAGFTDPTSGACTNASDPASARCAFGAGDDCKPCPRWPSTGTPAAVCPGGYRAWPVAGGYTPSEGSGVVLRCAPPAGERCLGWSAAASATVCGAGYSGAGCGGCAPSFYPSITGQCRACPAVSDMSPLLRAALLFTGIVAAACAAILALALLAARFIGGSVRGAFARCVELLAFLVSLLQMLGQVGRTLPPGLPPAVESVFAFLVTVQLEDPSLPTACWPEGYAFRNQVAQMAVALLLGGALVATLTLLDLRCCSCGRNHNVSSSSLRSKAAAGEGTDSASASGGAKTWRGCCNRKASPALLAGSKDGLAAQAPEARSACARLAAALPRLPSLLLKALFMVLALVYATVANTSLGLLACTLTPIDPGALASLDGGQEALAAGAAADAATSVDGTAGVLLLASDPSFVCWRGSHAPAAALAAVTVLLYVVGFPAGLILWGRRRVVAVADAGAAKELSVTRSKRPSIVGRRCCCARLDGCGALFCPRPLAGGPLHELATADAGSRAAYVRTHPLLSRARVLCCGWERALTRWHAKRSVPGAAKSAGKTPSPPEQGVQLTALNVFNAAARDPAALASAKAKARQSHALMFAAGSQRRVSVAVAASGVSASAAASPAAVGPRRVSIAAAGPSPRLSESKVLPSESAEQVLAAVAADEAAATAASVKPAQASPSGRAQRPSVVAIRRSSVVGVPNSSPASPSPSPSPGGPPPGLLLLHSLNTSGAIQADARLAAFLGTATRPASFQARQVDAAVLAGLAAVQLFWPAPSSVTTIAARCAVYAGLLLLDAWQTFRVNPFLLADGWKLRANVGFLLLAALAAVLTHVSLWASEAAVDGSGGDPAAERAREYLAWAFLVGAAVMLCLIVGGFLFAVVRDARGEAGEKRRQAAERAALLAAAAAAVPSLHRVVTPSPARRPSVAAAVASGAFAAVNPLSSPGGAGGDGDDVSAGSAASLRSLRSKRLSRAGPDADATADAAMRANPGAAVAAAVRRTSLAPMGVGGAGPGGGSFFGPSAAPSAMRSRSGKGLAAGHGRGAAASFGPTPMAGGAAAAGGAGMGRALAGQGYGLGQAGGAAAAGATTAPARHRRASRASVAATGGLSSGDGNAYAGLLTEAVAASRSAAEAE